VRWTATVSFEEGTCHFVTLSHDGVRPWVGDRLIIDAWRDQDSGTHDDDHIISKGNHTVTLECYERRLRAQQGRPGPSGLDPPGLRLLPGLAG